MDSSTIRGLFFDFFRAKGHQIVPSAPMVVKNDPTLMFTNAGMNQFKDIFLGNMTTSLKRVADTQKCLRVSGKHNDLEEVGHDTYHHTMFEMLGNWSFGDYFKKEAISWAWELLTGVYRLSPARLYATVFEGDKADGLSPDIEAREEWKAFLPDDHILYGSKKDNFWEMGDSGPCGPCSEIHVDLRPDEERLRVAGQELVNAGDPLVIEIWNLVFIEFDRKANGQLLPLPEKHIDTGMGFERLCMALQGKQSNYDTDVFQPIIQSIANKAGTRYGADPLTDIATRVVADHLRAISFALADGQLPSNTKGGYVIRRILRRAVRYGYVFLGFRQPFLCDLVPVLINQMGDVFPELRSQQTVLESVIREEESSFLRTLETGISRFQQYIQERKATDQSAKQERLPANIIDGNFAFELFDTYGFPVDLTQLMAREIGWTVDMERFQIGLEAQKNRSRKAASAEAGEWVILVPDAGLPVFTGYDQLTERTKITRYRRVQGKEKPQFHAVLETTPFYAESGGQAGDKGWLIKGEEKIRVSNTFRENELIIHQTDEWFSDPSGEIMAQVDEGERTLATNNHSATHLLQAALRQVLGNHVEQKGSLVEPDRLRFDFSHFSPMTPEEIRQTETLVNQKIRENLPLEERRDVAMEEAKKMGAVALFGEKYGNRVRVIRFGESFSTELCGGTHVPATGQIGLFRVLSQGGIAAGIRRIEAITGAAAEAFMYNREDLLAQVNDILKNPKNLVRGVEKVQEENQRLKKIAIAYEKLQQQEQEKTLREQVRIINGISFLSQTLDLDIQGLKRLAFELLNAIPDLFLVLGSTLDGKANLLVGLSPLLMETKNWHAGHIIRDLALEIEGSGGGQPHLATAGGKDITGIPRAFKKAEKLISASQ